MFVITNSSGNKLFLLSISLIEMKSLSVPITISVQSSIQLIIWEEVACIVRNVIATVSIVVIVVLIVVVVVVYRVVVVAVVVVVIVSILGVVFAVVITVCGLSLFRWTSPIITMTGSVVIVS